MVPIARGKLKCAMMRRAVAESFLVPLGNPPALHLKLRLMTVVIWGHRTVVLCFFFVFLNQSVSTCLQQHRQGSHMIQVHTYQHPQVPTFRLVPCPTLANSIPTQFALDEIQRVATKDFFPTTLRVGFHVGECVSVRGQKDTFDGSSQGVSPCEDDISKGLVDGRVECRIEMHVESKVVLKCEGNNKS